MNLLELYLTPLDAEQFRIIISSSNPPIDGNADSSLPFWENGKDWRTTIIKTLESNNFRTDDFPSLTEQDWMIRRKILSPDRQSFTPTYLKELGQALYQSLFPSDSSIREAFKVALHIAEQENEYLHLRLKFPGDSGIRSRLADYPWELIHDGQNFLQHRLIHLSRYIAHEVSSPISSAHEKVTILLISSRATDVDRGLHPLPNHEQQAILTGIEKAKEKEPDLITLEQLQNPTRKRLSAYLTECNQTPQILHFDGHGLFGKKCNNGNCNYVTSGIKRTHCEKCGQLLPESRGYLLFEDEQGEPDYVSASSFESLLVKGIELVVLSACQSGMSVAGESIFNGTAQQLIDARIPAVVAMQYAVLAEEASNFVEQFYRVLSKQTSLLEALNAGRKWMGVDGNQWYRPVLYLRWQANEGGQLFRKEQERKSNQEENSSRSNSPVKQRFSNDFQTAHKERRRIALVIGVGNYKKGLARLPSASRDAQAIHKILGSSDFGEFDDVQSIVNTSSDIAKGEIKKLFKNKSENDLILFFFSGHGIKDIHNKLYLATCDTYKDTNGQVHYAIEAGFIHEIMDACKSQNQVVILDCCFSGAFAKGLVVKDDSSIDIRNQLGGDRRVILTSSDSMQNSFGREGGSLSFYTKLLIEGIQTGQADLDKNQVITVDELHTYIRSKISRISPKMTPELYAHGNSKNIEISKTKTISQNMSLQLMTLMRSQIDSQILRKIIFMSKTIIVMLLLAFVLIRIECRIADYAIVNNVWISNLLRPKHHPQRQICNFVGDPLTR